MRAYGLRGTKRARGECRRVRVAYGLKERDMDKYANERGEVVVFPVNEVVGVLCLAGHTNCVCVCVCVCV